MTTQTLKIIVNAQGNRKVEIFRRSDEAFGFEELEWLDDPLVADSGSGSV
jgi:hypothetical protein